MRKSPDEENLARREVALFRFGLIAELLHLRPGSRQLGAALRKVSGREHAIPGSRRRRVAPNTLRDWMRLYRQGGFDALHPKPRSDRGRLRRLPRETAAALIEIKRKHPRLPVRQVILEVRARGKAGADLHLSPSTVYRLLRREGLTPASARDRQAAKDRRRFQFRFPNELWQSDVLHGPKVGSDPRDRRRRRKSYLLATLDDATRVIPHAAFAFSETYEAFLPPFKTALLKRGVPRRLYVDHGANYRARHLPSLCARLGVRLIHATVRQPAGKGKVERFFRRVRDQFLSVLDADATASLEALNRRLALWLDEYHHTAHGGLEGDTPQQRWALGAEQVRAAPPAAELDTLFLLRERRKVSKDRIVRLDNRHYEVGAELIGRWVHLLVDPAAPAGRPMPVELEGERVGQAALVDRYANALRGPRARQRPAERQEDSPPAKDGQPSVPPLRMSALEERSAPERRPSPAAPAEPPGKKSSPS